MTALVRRPTLRLLAACLFVAACLCVVAGKASAYVYWTNEGEQRVARANTDGSAPDLGFITGAGETIGLGIDGTHIYWANPEGGIGRANLDGSSKEPLFISGLELPFAVTVDSGHIYWSSTFSNKIGRAKLDGTEVEPSFITGLDFPWQIVSAGPNLYWSENGGGAIGRAKLDGTEVDNSFVSASAPKGLAIQGEYLYWVSDGEESIGRAKLDGTEVTTGLITNLETSTEMAVDSGHLYWTSRANGGTIGRSNLDGSNIERSFIIAGPRPLGLRVDDLPLPPTPPVTPPAEGGTGTPGTGTPDAPPKDTGTPAAPPKDAPAKDAPPAPCVAPTASASTFTPVPAPGRVVPGVRVKLTASTPSQLGVVATLSYKRDGKKLSADLGSYSLHVADSGNLRMALPRSLRTALPPKSKVNLALRITVAPDAAGPCGSSYERSASVATKIVNVLVSKAQAGS